MAMYTVKGIRGGEKRITSTILEQLRMQMDWQLRELGYDPASVTAACCLADTGAETAERQRLVAKWQAEKEEESSYS